MLPALVGALLPRSGDWTRNYGGPASRPKPGCPTPRNRSLATPSLPVLLKTKLSSFLPFTQVIPLLTKILFAELLQIWKRDSKGCYLEPNITISSGQKRKAPCEMSSSYSKTIVNPVLSHLPRKTPPTEFQIRLW